MQSLHLPLKHPPPKKQTIKNSTLLFIISHASNLELWLPYFGICFWYLDVDKWKQPPCSLLLEWNDNACWARSGGKSHVCLHYAEWKSPPAAVKVGMFRGPTVFMSAISAVTVKPNVSLRTLLRFSWPRRIVSLCTIWLLMSQCCAERWLKDCSLLCGSKKNNALFTRLKACLFSAQSHLHFIEDLVLKK